MISFRILTLIRVQLVKICLYLSETKLITFTYPESPKTLLSSQIIIIDPIYEIQFH